MRVSVNEQGEDWVAQVRINRKDTGEVVDGFTKFGENFFVNRESFFKELNSYLASLAPPEDWGAPDIVRIIINRYLDGKELEAKIYKDRIEDRSDEGAFSLYVELVNHAEKTVLGLAHSIALLSENDLERLVISDENEYSSEDPWIIDMLSAKTDLFKYILNPGDHLISAHKIHRGRLEKGI